MCKNVRNQARKANYYTSRGQKTKKNMGQQWKNIYQLAAVIVHTGDAYSGHFITYSGVPKFQNKKVLQTRAYMLFYEKTTNIGVF